MSWRYVADWAKRRPATLRLADRLGRSRGRLAVLDRIHPPVRVRHTPDIAGWENRGLAAVWIGHATILLRIGGMTILTDPVFSTRVGVGLGLMTAGPKRLVAPALSLRELPKIDLILISHAHFDHLDRPTLARLPKRIPVITAHHTGDLIRDLGFRKVTELDWGQNTRIAPPSDTRGAVSEPGRVGPDFDGASRIVGSKMRNGAVGTSGATRSGSEAALQITALSVAHWGARTFHDRHRGFNAYLIEGGNRRVLYGGDTAFHEGFKSLPPVDLAIMGIGAYDPYVAAHATPEQAWAMAEHCRAAAVLPMHHGTFRLSHEPVHEPLQRMVAAAGSDAGRIVVREVGGQWAEN